jgi:hypothetical protein
MWFTDICTALQIMRKALTDQLMSLYNLQPRKRTCKTFVADRKLATIDISMISAARFALNCQDSEAVLFSIILEEIDCEI